MTRIRKALAVIMSLAMLLTFIPAVSNHTDIKAADNFVITSPTEGKLVASGHFDITWNAATGGTVKTYTVYVDGENRGTSTSTKLDVYSTKVSMHTAYVEAEYTNGSKDVTPTINFGISKKGLGLATDMGANINLKEMGCSWYYNWGTGPSSGEQYQGVEFVPMQWGSDSYNNINTKMNNWAAKGYKYALAFNEPDLNGQGVISVADAVNRWPAFQNHGMYIGSPASYLWPKASSWLKDFMVQIDNNVDFITIHCYPDNYAGSGMASWFLEEVVDWTWETYHKPIWITEFSTTGSNVTATGGNGTKEFWEAVMPGLDEREYVERYAAFGFNAANNPGTGLWNYSTGELTAGGEIYKSYGNPEGYVPAPEVDLGYKVTTSVSKTVLSDSIQINGVTCTDYISQGGVTATASSQDNNGSGADKAIDDDISTRWESKHNVDPSYIILDLGSVKTIKQIGIVWESASASDYTIDVSTDGVNYTTVAKAEGLSSVQNRFDTIKLSNLTQARYIRINGTARTTTYGYSIYDMAVYGTTDSKVDETTTQAPTTKKVVTTAATTTKKATVTTKAPVTTKTTTITGNEGNTGSTVETGTGQLEETTVAPSAENINTMPKVKVKKATKKKAAKKIKVRLTKVKKGIKYQIKITKTKKGKKALVKKIVKKRNSVIKSKKLANRKKLYIKVRSVLAVNGKRSYGVWSKAKKIKIK